MHPFDQVTAITPHESGWRAELDPAWYGAAAPHGGVLAAIAMRALTRRVADDAHTAQMLALRFLRAPRDGELTVRAVAQRSGRRTTSVVATLSQGDRVCVEAAAAFATFDADGPAFGEPPPEIPTHADTPAVTDRAGWPPFTAQLDMRLAIGDPPFSGSAQTTTGGWLQSAEPHPLDPPFLAFLCDAWFPSVYPRLPGPTAVPTLDLSVHFLVGLREPLAAAPVCVRFDAPAAAGGLFVEDGAMWTAAGTPLVRSRQSALLLTPGA